MKRIVLTALMSLLLLGCSGDPYEKYYGLWERQNKKMEFMKISRDGETILMTDRILDYKLSIFDGKKEKQENRIRTLNQIDGKLSLKTGFGGVQFGLSEDENTLRVDNRAYKRIDEARLKEANIEFDSKFEENKKNKEKCKILRDDFKKERTAIYDKQKSKDFYNGKTNKEIQKQIAVLKSQRKSLAKQYQTKAKEINNCNLAGFF
jgi:hypothetical protein